MAMNTRSGAPPTAPTVASRATKTTAARKTSKARSKPHNPPKSSKANTTNRVQKRAPTKRVRHIDIDEDSHTVDNTSRTASPDYISDTPVPSRRVIPETPPPSNQAQLEADIARLQRKLRHQRHKACSLTSSSLSDDFNAYLNGNSDAKHFIEASPTGIPVTTKSNLSKKAINNRRDYIYSRDSPFQLDEKNGCWEHRHKDGTLRPIVLKHNILNVLLGAYAASRYKGVHSLWHWVESRYAGILRRDVEKFLGLLEKQLSTATGLQRTTKDPFITNQVIKEFQIKNRVEDIEVQNASPLTNSYSSRPPSPKDVLESNPSLRTTQSPETSHTASTIKAIYHDTLPNPLDSEYNSENLATTDSVDRPNQESKDRGGYRAVGFQLLDRILLGRLKHLC